MLKIKQTILLTVILVFIVALSGCTNHNNQDNNQEIKTTSIETGDINSNNSSNPISDSTLSDSKYEKSGICYHVVDGDTIDVEGVGRVRLVGVNTPERGEPGYRTATDYVKSMVLGKEVGLNIDDAKNRDKYDRILAVVYIGDVNLNQELLKKGLAEIMYIPPSEFNPYSWS